MREAEEVYTVEGEDRPVSSLRRRMSWVATAVAGAFQLYDAPSLSDIVVRDLDGTELARHSPGSYDDFRSDLADALVDLASMDEHEFAARWIHGSD